MGGNLAGSLRLVLVTDDRLLRGRDLLEVAQAAVRGGVTAVQVRLKYATPREVCAAARKLRRKLPVPVLVNDRLDVALAAGAAGAHLGPADVEVALARTIVPPGFILGASVGGAEEMVNGAEADYWGVGPFRATGTKADAGAALGAAGLATVVDRSGERPCVAIGGIRPEDVPAVLKSGARGVAVVSGILGEEDVAAAARRYAEALR